MAIEIVDFPITWRFSIVFCIFTGQSMSKWFIDGFPIPTFSDFSGPGDEIERFPQIFMAF
jgi:hypothetical protein